MGMNALGVACTAWVNDRKGLLGQVAPAPNVPIDTLRSPADPPADPADTIGRRLSVRFGGPCHERTATCPRYPAQAAAHPPRTSRCRRVARLQRSSAGH